MHFLKSLSKYSDYDLMLLAEELTTYYNVYT